LVALDSIEDSLLLIIELEEVEGSFLIHKKPNGLLFSVVKVRKYPGQH